VDTYLKVNLYRPKSRGRVMLPSIDHLRIFGKYGELIGNKKNGEILFCVLYAFLCVAAKLKKKKI
jgi:hypothetical protein